MGATILIWPRGGRTSSAPIRRSAHRLMDPRVDDARDVVVDDGMALDAEGLRKRRLRALQGLRAAIEAASVDMADLVVELERARARAAARLARENIRTFRNQLELLDLLEAERPLHTPERR